MAIGATNNDDNGLNSGHVRVYENIGGLWSQRGQDIDGEASEDESGHSVSLSSDGNTVAIGAQRNDGNGLNSGHVRIYQNIGGSWFQIGQDIDGEASEDESGFSVSLNADGNTIAIGAQRNDGNGSNSGHVRIYENTSGSWTQIGQDIDGEASDDYNGHSVSLSNDGNTVAIGADGNDGNGTDAGHVRVYNLSTPCADLGCLDPLALNFDPNATVSDSTCIYPNYGCLDLLALNYNSLANIDDGSCNYCTNDTSYTNIISCGSVVWNGVSYTSSGVYSNIYTDLYGCDSTAILDLTINNSTLSTVSITSCDSYVWDGITYFSTGLYTNIYTGINGCDSIIILNLVINNTSSSTLTVTACSSYDWDGFTYDSTGIYTNVYTDINGCDSTVTLDLLINIETSSLTTVTACDSFLWNSITFNNSVFYTIILTNSVGCDSVATLFLTINNSISTTFSDSTCDIYLWDGITYDSTGLYTNIYTSLNGCDSIVTLDLSVVVCYGCTDPLACNFDSTVTIDDGSCLVDYGCTDPLAFNYDSLATCNDGSCIPFIYGCTDPNAINFYAGANTDDGSCIYLGCTDPLACNYDSIATLDDGSCLVDYGCMDPLALNYDSLATCDDSSCIAIIYGCTDSTATNYNPGANLDDGSCIFSGCTDSLALNYNLLAIIDDGSCIYYSCLQPAPINIFTSDITDIRATVNWDNMNSVDCKVLKYNIRFREVGTPTWVTKSGGAGNGLCNFGVNNTSKILYNLDPGTTYQYKIKAYYCFGGSSTWTLPNYFTTDDDCPSINNLSVLTYPANTGKVTFSWNPGNYVFARVLLRVDSVGASWQTAGGFGVYQPNLSVNKFGLQQGQSYRAQARAFCDSNITSYRSWWTNPIFWTQPTIRLGNGTSISHLYVYPNPSRDVFNISFNSETLQDLSIRILNVVGAQVYRETKEQFIGEYTKQISLDDYGKGIYFLEIETNDGVINKKLILQ